MTEKGKPDEGAAAQQADAGASAAIERGAAAEARAAILTRRVAALEAVLSFERRLREAQEASGRAAVRADLPDVTVPRPHALTQSPARFDDDATIPAPRQSGMEPSMPSSPASTDPSTATLPTSPSRPHRPGDPSAATLPTSPSRPHNPTVPSQRNPQPIRQWTQPASVPLPDLTQQRGSAPHGGAGVGATLALACGFELFEYRIDAVLGQGGFGITYLATDVNLNVRVAIKEYLPGAFAQRGADRSVSPRWPEDQDFYLNGLESFLAEARTLASFRHANIVRVARFFEAHDTAYMVLEYERGRPLKQLRDALVALPEQQLLSLLQPLLDGLAQVHQAGYLHRDIKPDNIYVRKEDGSLVLLDFGAARLAAGGSTALADVVTPGYAPPEQYEGGAQGPWTDIYALGATLYWLVTGEKPPAAPARLAGTVATTPAAIKGKDRYSATFLEAIDWALAPEPERRPRSVALWSQRLFAAHSGSLPLLQALRAADDDDLREEAADGAQAGSDEALTPAQLKRRWRRRLLRRILHPPSWPMVIKLSAAMVAAALLPMLIIAWYTLSGSTAALANSELRNLERLAQSSAGRIGQMIDDNGRLAAFLSAEPGFIDYLAAPTPAGKAALDARLAALVRLNPDVFQIYLLDAGGATRLSSDEAMLGVNLSFRDYFKEALQGHSYTTGIVVGSSDAAPGLYYANPVHAPAGSAEERRVVGVVVLRIKGSSLAAVLDEANAGGARKPFMIDGDGVLVHYPDRRQLYHSLRPLPAARQKALIAERRFGTDPVASLGVDGLARAVAGARTHGNVSYHSPLSGGDEYAGFSPVSGHADLVVGVSESRRQFEAPVRHLLQNVLYGVAIVGLIFLVLGIVSARSIVRPVARLSAAVNALRDGQYDAAHIEIRSYDEIGRLARAFNVMIDVLRQRERERGRRGPR